MNDLAPKGADGLFKPQRSRILNRIFQFLSPNSAFINPSLNYHRLLHASYILDTLPSYNF